MIYSYWQAKEYESRLFDGGSYSPSRLRTAPKDAPIHMIIANARESYNKMRVAVSLPPVTNWNLPPEQRIAKA